MSGDAILFLCFVNALLGFLGGWLVYGLRVRKLEYGVSRVYDHITGGRISKPYVRPSAVILEADCLLQSYIDDAIADYLDEKENRE